MLISIAATKHKSSYLGSFLKNPVVSMHELRTKILNSVKILVSPELADIEGIGTYHIAKIFGKDPKAIDVAEKRELYHRYGKMPFSSIFIENEGGGLLVEKIEKVTRKGYAIDDGVYTLQEVSFDTRITLIHEGGFVCPIHFLLNTDASFITGTEGELDPFPTPILAHGSDMEMRVGYELARQLLIKNGSTYGVDAVQYYTNFGTACAAILFEVLLFLNASNTEFFNYKAKPFELKDRPAAIHSKFEYKVLDIYRTKKQYSSMEDILNSLRIPEGEKQTRRAHLVRGHFKRKNGKLFWWNPFMRNRKNAVDVGVVDKDYNLVDNK